MLWIKDKLILPCLYELKDSTLLIKMTVATYNRTVSQGPGDSWGRVPAGLTSQCCCVLEQRGIGGYTCDLWQF